LLEACGDDAIASTLEETRGNELAPFAQGFGAKHGAKPVSRSVKQFAHLKIQ
jgi:hypothetical protein